MLLVDVHAIGAASVETGMTAKMKAAVFAGPNRVEIREKPIRAYDLFANQRDNVWKVAIRPF
ncbi:hypothetical protein D3C87_2056680 [compost metagenome]